MIWPLTISIWQGLVTVTEKLNRRAIVKAYHSQIKEAFKLDQLPLK